MRERAFEQDAALALRHGAQVAAADRDRVERHERRRRRLCQLGDARGGRMKPHLERVEIEPVGRGDHDLAVHHTAVRQPGQKGLMELRKVAIERPEVPTLDEDLGSAAKDDRAKPVPFGLVQKRPRGELLCELREHRLDRRRDGKDCACRRGSIFDAAAPAATLTGVSALDVYLIDGTYELFRHYYALPPARDPNGREVAAVRGVLLSVLSMINGGAQYVGVATDHVIESFRNQLWPGYKTGAGIEPDLLAQFPLLEETLSALGIVTWPMVEFEADDALAAAAAAAARDPRVDRVIICTPDKDLAQCVRGTRIVQMDRRTRTIRDEAGIVAKFGVPPASIPDYLALVGDAADGYPGLPGWGAKSTAAVLARYGHLESIPADWRAWGVDAANPGALAHTLARERDRAFLFRDLATLRSDIPLFDSVDDLRWTGPRPAFAPLAARLDAAVSETNPRGLQVSSTPPS